MEKDSSAVSAPSALFIAPAGSSKTAIALLALLKQKFPLLEKVSGQGEIAVELHNAEPQVVFLSPELEEHDVKLILAAIKTTGCSARVVALRSDFGSCSSSASAFHHIVFDSNNETELLYVCDEVLRSFAQLAQREDRERLVAQINDHQVQLAAAYAEASWQANQRKFVSENNQALLDSFESVYMLVDKAGTVQMGGSTTMYGIFGEGVLKQKFWQLLVKHSAAEEFSRQWIKWVFETELSFDALAELMPHKYKNEIDEFSLQYRLLTNANGQREALAVIFVPITKEVRKKASQQRDRMQMKLAFRYFLEADELNAEVDFLRKLLDELKQSLSEGDLKKVGNYLTGIKGSLLGVYMHDPIEMVDKMRTFWMQSKIFEDKAANKQVCDALIEQYEKIYLTINTLVDDLSKLETSNVDVKAMSATHTNLIILSEMFKRLLATKSIALQHFDRTFVEDTFAPRLNRFRKIIQEMAKDEHKPIHYYVYCENIFVPLNIYEPLVNTFQRAFRNAVVHGIETAEKRATTNKPEMGKIYVIVDTEYQGKIEFLRFRIIDDGGGIDPDVIRKLAVKREIKTEDEAKWIDEEEIIQLVLDKGFSSKQNVDGQESLGMDSIVAEANKIGGSVRMYSTVGEGTEMQILVPIFRSYAAFKTWHSIRNQNEEVDGLDSLKIAQESMQAIEDEKEAGKKIGSLTDAETARANRENTENTDNNNTDEEAA